MKSMILAVTEFNAWEHERWTYVLDLTSQHSDTLNNLFIFARLANEQFHEMKRAQKQASDLFAASRYWVRFYDDVEPHERNGGYVKLISTKGRGKGLQLNVDPSNGGYKGNMFDLTAVISWMKMKAALNTMVKKKENILYKRFEDVFLKK